MPPHPKLQVLHAFQPLARSLGVYRAEHFSCERGKSAVARNILQTIAYTVLCLSLVAASLISCWMLVALPMDRSERAFHLGLVLVHMQQAVMYTAMTKENRQVFRALGHLQQTVDKRIGRSRALYEQIEHRFGKLLKKASKIMAIAVAVMHVPTLSQPLLYAIFSRPKPDDWVLSADFITPLTGATGFIVVMPALVSCSIAYFFVVSRSVLYFFGMSSYISAMVDDLAGALDDIDTSSRNRSTAKRRQQALANEIQFHTEILDLAKMVGDSLSEMIFYQLLFTAIELATFMFVVDETDVLSPASNVAIIAISTILVPTLLFCKLSENVTGCLEIVGDHFYGIPWYSLGPKQQKLFVLTIQRAQKQFRINGLGIVDCSLEIFALIIRSTFSYFLLLRSL